MGYCVTGNILYNVKLCIIYFIAKFKIYFRKERVYMAVVKQNERGRIRISNAVIAKLAGYATTSCYGVVGMSMRSGKDCVARLLKMENIDKGIKVKIEDNVIHIALYIIVAYGVNIRTIGETIQNSVKYAVEKALGIEVGDIIVNIEGVRE